MTHVVGKTQRLHHGSNLGAALMRQGRLMMQGDDFGDGRGDAPACQHMSRQYCMVETEDFALRDVQRIPFVLMS